MITKVNSKAKQRGRKKAAEENREPITFPKITPHSFRHTFATRCFESGINGKIVQKYLGHSSMAMTMDLYTHVDEDLMAANISKIDNLF
ncbi:MAG: tyrosine-type recombinase/integrase [Clostridiales bacterium]|nr:tyrosine-type recombinase/integrase [Clostridiales bacterium]